MATDITTPPQPENSDPTPDREVLFAEYDQLPQPMRAEYRQQKLTYAKAYAAFDAAQSDALKAFQKPWYDWKAATQALEAAQVAQTAAIGRGRNALDAINAMTAKPDAKAGDAGTPTEVLDPAKLTDPDLAKAQTARLQEAVDDYKKAAADVAAAAATVETTGATLAGLSEPGDPKTLNSRTQQLAADQYALDVATAQTPLEAQYDALVVKQTELISRIGKVATPARAKDPAPAGS